MQQDLYIARAGAAYGPITIDETNRLVVDGELTLKTMVWDERSSKWMEASDHPIIARIFDDSKIKEQQKELSELAARRLAQEKVLATLEERCRERASEEARLIERCAEQDSEIKSVADQLASIRREVLEFERKRIEAQGQEASAAFDDSKIQEQKKELAELDAQKLAQEKVLATLEALRREETAVQEAKLAEVDARKLAQEKVLATLEARCREAAAQETKLAEVEARRLAQEKVLATLEARCRDAAGEETKLAEVRARRLAQEKALETLEARCREVANEEAKLNEQCIAQDSEIHAVKERLGIIRSEVEELEQKRVAAQALLGHEVSKAFDDIKATIGDLAGLTSAWNDAKQSDDHARRVGIEAVTQITALLKEREVALNGLFVSFGRQIRSDVERAAVEDAAAEAGRRLNEMTEELKSVTILCYAEAERLDEYRREREQIRSEIVSEEGRLADLLPQKSQLCADIADVTGILSSLQIDLRSLQCETDALKRERGVHEGAIEELRRLRGNVLESYLQVENDLATFTSQATGAAARAAELDRKSIALEAQILDRRAELEQIEEDQKALLAARAELKHENEEMDRSAVEARQEVEAELEDQLRNLADTKTLLMRAHEEARLLSAERELSLSRLAHLKEEMILVTEKNNVILAALDQSSKAAAEYQNSIAEKEILLGRLRETEGEMMARVERLEQDVNKFNAARAEAEAQYSAMWDRTKSVEAEMVALEKERAVRGMSDLSELRDLLRVRETKERENLERLMNEARVEHKRLRDDWASEERAGVTNDELRKLRTEVEDKRRDVVKAERQLSAMRAGLSKLREENGRSLLQRVQSFEMQQLDDLRRRIVESKSEIETLETDWTKEMKSAEIVDKQWFEIKSAVNEAQA